MSLKLFLNEQRVFKRYYRYHKYMFLKTLEKVKSAEGTEQSATINFWVDFGETSIETKQMMEER